MKSNPRLTSVQQVGLEKHWGIQQVVCFKKLNEFRYMVKKAYVHPVNKKKDEGNYKLSVKQMHVPRTLYYKYI